MELSLLWVAAFARVIAFGYNIASRPRYVLSVFGGHIINAGAGRIMEFVSIGIQNISCAAC